MSNSISYEHSFADVHIHGAITRISYIVCRPPRQLKPKGTLLLLHDFFKTNYQFRYVIDLFAAAGYNTFALDLPGVHISSRTQQNNKISVDSLCTDLLHFIHLDMIQSPLHLAGIGMGAQLASHFARKHSDHVATIAMIDPQRSEKSEEALKFLSSSSTKIPSTVRRNAFDRYLDHSTCTSPFNAPDDLDEYADSFSKPQSLLSMQQAYSSFLITECDANSHPVKATKMTWSPEEQPEDFAIAILGTLRVAAQSVMTEVNLKPQLHHQTRLYHRHPPVATY